MDHLRHHGGLRANGHGARVGVGEVRRGAGRDRHRRAVCTAIMLRLLHVRIHGRPSRRHVLERSLLHAPATTQLSE